MKNFHFISTDTSILDNFSREEKKFKEIHDKYSMKDWAKLKPNDDKQKHIEAHIPRGDEVLETLYEFVKKNPNSASAEF